MTEVWTFGDPTSPLNTRPRPAARHERLRSVKPSALSGSDTYVTAGWPRCAGSRCVASGRRRVGGAHPTPGETDRASWESCLLGTCAHGPFDKVTAAVGKGRLLGFAFPLKSGYFQVLRFSLVGASSALVGDMRQRASRSTPTISPARRGMRDERLQCSTAGALAVPRWGRSSPMSAPAASPNRSDDRDFNGVLRLRWLRRLRLRIDIEGRLVGERFLDEGATP